MSVPASHQGLSNPEAVVIKVIPLVVHLVEIDGFSC